MARTDISWAGRVLEMVGGANAGWALEAPDGDSWGIGDGQGATFGGWDRASYDGLAELLAAARPPGDVVTPEMLQAADVIAWELNGNSPARSGGWESCRWLFRDSQSSVEVVWNEGTANNLPGGPPVPRDPHIVANGSITGAAYGGFFGIPDAVITQFQPASTPEEIVFSFLLFRLRDDLDATDPAFTLTLGGVPAVPGQQEATPDADAIGILSHAATQPGTARRPRRSRARVARELCQTFKTADVVVPTIAALWDRHQAGLPARNVVETRVYDVIDAMSAPTRQGMAAGFGAFSEFRDLRVDGCGLFDHTFADTLDTTPLDHRSFLDKIAGNLMPLAAEQLYPHSHGQAGPGKARIWRPPAAATDPDDHGPGLLPPGPWPWLTAIRIGADSADEGGITDFGNSESLAPTAPPPFVPIEPQFAHLPHVTVDGSGQPQVTFERAHPPSPPPVTGPDIFPIQTFCEGGPRYTVGNDCLQIPEQANGEAFQVRGFNLTNVEITAHLRREDHPDHHVHSVQVVVYSDKDTPVTDAEGNVIIGPKVSDWIHPQIPLEDPENPGQFFPAGLYGVWVTVTDTTDPGHPVVRDSNALLLRVVPSKTTPIRLQSDRGRCIESTAGFGDDEIWWKAWIARAKLANPDPTGGTTPVLVTEPVRVDFPHGPWDDVSDGDAVTFSPVVLHSGPLARGEVVAVGVFGIEVDSEHAADPDTGIRDFGSAFEEGLLAVIAAVLGSGALVTGIGDILLKAGVITATTAAIGLIVLGAVVVAMFAGLALWAIWAAPDVIGLDALTLDARSVTDLTEPTKPLPPTTSRTLGSGDDEVVVTSRSLGTRRPSNQPVPYDFENEYRTGRADYALQFRLTRAAST